MGNTKSSLAIILGENYNEDVIKQYSDYLLQENKVPFINLHEDNLAERLFIEIPDGDIVSLATIYNSIDYPLNRGPFFFSSEFSINNVFDTPIIFVQDGVITLNPRSLGEFHLMPWDTFEKVLLTHDGNPSEPTITMVPLFSYGPIDYTEPYTSEIFFVYTILQIFWKVVEKNRGSLTNRIPFEIFSMLYMEDLKGLDLKNANSITETKSSDSDEEEVVNLLMNLSDIKNLEKEAMSYVESENWGDAVDALTRLIDIAEPSTAYYNLRGRCNLEDGDFTDAIRDFNKAIDINNNDEKKTEAYNALALTLFTAEEYDRAIAHCDKAIAAGINELMIYEIGGISKEILKDYNGALDDYKKLYNLQKKNGEDTKSAEDAIERVQKLIKNTKQEKVIEPETKIEDLENKAISYVESEEWDKAIEVFTKIIDTVDSNYLYYQLRGKCYYEIKEYDKAIKDFNKAIELNTDSGNIYESYIYIALILFDLKEYDKAISHCNKAISAGINDPMIYEIRGISKEISKDYTGALEDYKKLYDLRKEYGMDTKSSEDAIEGVQKLIKNTKQEQVIEPETKIEDLENKAISYVESEEWDKAIEVFTKIIDTVDSNYLYYQLRGKCYYEIKEYDKAIKDFNKAIELNTDSGNIYESYIYIALILFDLKEYDKAISHCNKAISAGINDPMIYEIRGISKEISKDYTGALEDYKKLYDLRKEYGMDTKSAKDAIEGVQKLIKNTKQEKVTKFESKLEKLREVAAETVSKKEDEKERKVVLFDGFEDWISVVLNGQEENAELGLKKIKPQNVSEKEVEVARELYNKILSTFEGEGDLLTQIFSPTSGCSFYYNKKKVAAISFGSKRRIELYILRDFAEKYFKPNIENLNVENIREEHISRKVPWAYQFYLVIDNPEKIKNNIDKLVYLIGNGITTIKYGKVLSVKKDEFKKLKPIFEGSFDA